MEESALKIYNQDSPEHYNLHVVKKSPENLPEAISQYREIIGLLLQSADKSQVQALQEIARKLKQQYPDSAEIFEMQQKIQKLKQAVDQMHSKYNQTGLNPIIVGAMTGVFLSIFTILNTDPDSALFQSLWPAISGMAIGSVVTSIRGIKTFVVATCLKARAALLEREIDDKVRQAYLESDYSINIHKEEYLNLGYLF